MESSKMKRLSKEVNKLKKENLSLKIQMNLLNKKFDEKIKELKPIKKIYSKQSKGLNLTLCLQCYLQNDLRVHQINNQKRHLIDQHQKVNQHHLKIYKLDTTEIGISYMIKQTGPCIHDIQNYFATKPRHLLPNISQVCPYQLLQYEVDLWCIKYQTMFEDTCNLRVFFEDNFALCLKGSDNLAKIQQKLK